MRSSSRRIWLAGVALSIFASLVLPSRPALAELTFEVVKSFERPETESGPLVLGNDGALYGATYTGGSSDRGTIYRIDSAGNFTTLHSFDGADGVRPASLVAGSDGTLYGTTPEAGYFSRGGVFTFSAGTVFKIDSAGNFTTLHFFNGTERGNPIFALVVGSDGALYGTTTSYSGSYGTVFRIDRAGNFTTLHSFNGSTDGSGPGGLVMGGDGALYGTTAFGGPFNIRTLFKIDSAGAFISLHSFDLTDGGDRPAVVLGRDGALYGVISDGGSSNRGEVFRIDGAGNFLSLLSFSGPDGHSPTALVLGGDGALYGTTAFGGSNAGSGNGGTVFRIDRAGTFTSLHSFSGVDGAAPGPLVLGSDGALYGTTSAGGSSNIGTVFRIDSAGTFTSLHSFSGGSHIDYGARALVPGSDSAIYGVTIRGGTADSGMVFRIDSEGTFTPLHSFHAADGSLPQAALALASDGALYGTTLSGGALNAGTVYKVDGTGTFFSLHSFTGMDGSYAASLVYPWPPAPALVPGSNGSVYGTTPSGGSSGLGTVFQIDRAGAFTSLHSFDIEDGSGEYASLVVSSDGTLYGTTGMTVFKIDAEGTYGALLHAFEVSPCSASYGSSSGPVVLGSDGTLYGISSYECGFGEGSIQRAVIFRIDRAGTYTSLHSFSDFDQDCCPTSLVLGSDGALYGTTMSPSSSVFRIDRAGNFRVLHSFNTSMDGGYPNPRLVVGSDGAFYGTTVGGGSSNMGTLFRVDSAGTFSSLYSFSFYPRDDFVVASDGAFYGIGSMGYGAIYRIDSAGAFTLVHSFSGSPGTQGQFSSLVVGSDCALYGTEAEGGPGDGGYVYRLFEPGRLCQRIAFEPLPDRALGDPPLTVSAAASSGLPVSFSASGRCSLSGDQVRLKTGVGVCRVTASQAGDSRFEAAAEVTQEFRVWPPRRMRSLR